MKTKLNSIMLLDDNEASNYIHSKFIMKAKCTDEVVTFQNGFMAIDYLKNGENSVPEMLIMDINMPEMSGWNFLDNLVQIDRVVESLPVIVMLTTSLSPMDDIRAQGYDILEY